MKHASFLIPALVITVLTAAVVSCSKNNSSKPKLTITSINTIVDSGGSLDVKFKFTSGTNLPSGTFTSIRIRQNQKPPSNPSGGDTIVTPIPAFPSVNSGEFDYTLPYTGYLNEDVTQNDTFLFKFAAVNANGVSSDTLTTPIIVSLLH